MSDQQKARIRAIEIENLVNKDQKLGPVGKQLYANWLILNYVNPLKRIKGVPGDKAIERTQHAAMMLRYQFLCFHPPGPGKTPPGHAATKADRIKYHESFGYTDYTRFPWSVFLEDWQLAAARAGRWPIEGFPYPLLRKRYEDDEGNSVYFQGLPDKVNNPAFSPDPEWQADPRLQASIHFERIAKSTVIYDPKVDTWPLAADVNQPEPMPGKIWDSEDRDIIVGMQVGELQLPDPSSSGPHGRTWTEDEIRQATKTRFPNVPRQDLDDLIKQLKGE